MQAFLQNLEMFGLLLLVVAGCIVGYYIWHRHVLAEEYRKSLAEQRKAEAARRRREEALAQQEEQKGLMLSYQAQLVQHDLDMRQFQMQLAYNVQQQGGTFEWTQHGFRASGASMKHLETPSRPQIAAPVMEDVARLSSLPTNVRYEDIRTQVPKGHILVGIGRLGVETRDAIVGACLWIVGLSGTGKTSTTVLRVEERYADGHRFLGVDPHWFKPDSLTNAIVAYAPHFIIPMAKTPQETKAVFTMFLEEFKNRKSGRVPQPWQKITLLVDEVGSLMDPTDEEEEEIKAMLPSIARICGQEARNFNMGGIFISQTATGLAWLRKMALMIIVHQMLQKNEIELATNYDRDVLTDMKSWPIGRTYVYGVGFQDGPRTVQQPYFATPRIVNAIPASHIEDLQPRNTDKLREQQAFKSTSHSRPFLHVVEVDTEGAIEAVDMNLKGSEAVQEQNTLSERELLIGKKFFDEHMGLNAIAKELWPDVKGGDAFQKNAAIVADAIRKVAAQMKVGA